MSHIKRNSASILDYLRFVITQPEKSRSKNRLTNNCVLMCIEHVSVKRDAHNIVGSQCGSKYSRLEYFSGNTEMFLILERKIMIA